MLANKIGATDAAVVKTIADYYEFTICDLAKADRIYRDSDRFMGDQLNSEEQLGTHQLERQRKVLSGYYHLFS